MVKTLYALQTNQGLLQVTKGTYLSFIRRQEKEKKTRAKLKYYETQNSFAESCCSIRTVRISKRTKSKPMTTKKFSQTYYDRIGLKTRSKHKMSTRSNKITIHHCNENMSQNDINHNHNHNNNNHSCSQESIVLYTLNGKVEYPIYQDRYLFPKQIQSINIPMCFDNDCDSDEEEIAMAVDSLATSLSLAVYDHKYYKQLN